MLDLSILNFLLPVNTLYFKEVNGDTKVHEDRLHLYSLISGTPVWHGSADTVINTSKGLDWKRAFAITLWFLSTPSSSIADALADYESAFLGHSQYGEYAVSPKPPYQEQIIDEANNSETYDIKYHLLKVTKFSCVTVEVSI